MRTEKNIAEIDYGLYEEGMKIYDEEVFQRIDIQRLFPLHPSDPELCRKKLIDLCK